MSKDKEMPEKADLQSLDISAENRTQLKQLFPSVFTETKDERGELVESIDLEKLKAELGTFSDVFEARRERYGMDWPGKKDCMKLIQKSSIATLKPCREESVNFDETENLFIEGDNLEILKLLQKSYYGKVKMIYIDPPYNTGKEFIYPDDYSESLDTYLAYAGLIDDEGKRFSTNTANEGRFHTKWLNMMYPRIYLARNLLKDSGIIFISIDDNEMVNLKKLCDEIFGEINNLGTFIWHKKLTGGYDSKWLNEQHEYIIAYCKNKDNFEIGRIQKESKYKLIDEQGRKYKWDSLWSSSLSYSKSLDYQIEAPDGSMIDPIGPKGKAFWLWSKEKVEREKHLLRFAKDNDSNWKVYKRVYASEEGIIPGSILEKDIVKGNTHSANEIRDIFGERIYDYSKPIDFNKFLVHLGNLNPDDIVLDFFSGSCTTAIATINLNNEDNGKRKFIMVQLPEPCDIETESSELRYDTIADIGKERIRRIIKKIEEEQEMEAKKAKGDLLKSQEKHEELDLGFKVFKLDKSNFAVWDGSEPMPTEQKLAEQLEAFVEHIDPKATQEDILFELLLKAGFKPTEKIEKKEFAGKRVFSIAEGLLLICLEDEITKELIEAVAEAEPLQFICLDRGFKGNDQLKANAVQTFAARNQGRDKQDQIVFRTV